MNSLREEVQQIRRVIPLPVQLAMARRRIATLWENDDFRTAQEANMRFLLEHTERAEEIEKLAREYAEFDAMRQYRRWRPRHLVRQPVRGIEWLTTKRDTSRGLVLNFMHHGHYDGLMGSLGRAGVNLHAVAAPEAFDPKAPVQIRQHFKVCTVPGSPLVNAAEGSARLIEVLQQRHILAIASDVASRTSVTFLGRDMLASYGAARIATETNSPVALFTSHQDAAGNPYFQVHEPLEPGDFAEPSDLLTEIFRLHEPAVLAWPAAYDSPFGRLAIPAQVT